MSAQTVYRHLNLQMQNNGILLITINRPLQRNALTIDALEEIEKLFIDVYSNQTIRAVIITGSGDKSFVAGADINEFISLNPADSKQFAERGQRILRIIEESPKPVVAAINGFALGGGCELAMACHLRIASSSALFGQPEVKLGIIPGYGGTQRLIQLVGKTKAVELMLVGDPVSAKEGHRIGLLNYVVEPENLLSFSMDILGKMLKNSPSSLANVIKSVNAYFDFQRDGYAAEADAFTLCCQTADFREGTQAFLEKRLPNFSVH